MRQEREWTKWKIDESSWKLALISRVLSNKLPFYKRHRYMASFFHRFFFFACASVFFQNTQFSLLNYFDGSTSGPRSVSWQCLIYTQTDTDTDKNLHRFKPGSWSREIIHSFHILLTALTATVSIYFFLHYFNAVFPPGCSSTVCSRALCKIYSHLFVSDEELLI